MVESQKYARSICFKWTVYKSTIACPDNAVYPYFTTITYALENISEPYEPVSSE